MTKQKSDLEKALEFIPSYAELTEQQLDPYAHFDFPDVYETLRAAEKGYEQLQTLGRNVTEKLTERRFELAELAAKLIDLEFGEIQRMIVDRDKTDGLGSLPDFKTNMIEFVNKLDEYIRKLYPNSFNRSPRETDYFPEP